MGQLLEGFESLEPFVADWALPNSQARLEQRFNSDMGSIQAFYQAIQPLAEKALTALEAYPLDAMPPEAERLYQLLMSLAHIAIAVERHNQPRPRSVTWPSTLQVSLTVGPA